MREPRTVLPRALAGFAGLLLAGLAGFGWYLADLLLAAVETSDAALTDVGDGATQLLHTAGGGLHVDAALAGSSGLERLGHSTLGSVSAATEQFQMLILLSLLAGVAAVAVATQRRPLQRWPELTWVAAALMAVAPGIVLHFWVVVSAPLAVVIALAAFLHLTRRHDLTIARGAAAARRGTAHVTPRIQSAGERGSAGASRVLQAGRAQLPAARDQAEAVTSRVAQTGREHLPAARAQAQALGQRGKSIAGRSAPAARATLRRFRGKDGETQ